MHILVVCFGLVFNRDPLYPFKNCDKKILQKWFTDGRRWWIFQGVSALSAMGLVISSKRATTTPSQWWEHCNTRTALQAPEAYKHQTNHLRSTYTQTAKEALTVTLSSVKHTLAVCAINWLRNKKQQRTFWSQFLLSFDSWIVHKDY